MAKDGKKLTGDRNSNNPALAPQISSVRRLVGTPKETPITFSFKFFKQCDFFQLGGQDRYWFMSVIDRLHDLSEKDASLLGDTTAKQRYRIHPINWEQPHIPIKKEDLNWIPKTYLQNPEIEFLQFEITKSLGRVVGFFNETNDVFYIVLLDPKHNIQPAQSTGYRVDKTYECLTDYEKLLHEINDKKVSEKYLSHAYRMIWLEEELAAIFYKHRVEEIADELESFLFERYPEDLT